MTTLGALKSWGVMGVLGVLGTLSVLAGCSSLPTQISPASVPVADAPMVSGTDMPPPPAAVAPTPAEPKTGATTAATTQTPAAKAALSPGLSPIDLLDPEAEIDFRKSQAQADLWQRIRLGFAMPDAEGPLVQSSEQWYASKPDYVQRMTERGGRYLFHILEEVQRRQLPTELALLPFIESAFNPQALSRAKASGMWQFMPATGKGFDLKQNVFRDDRRHVLASTRAALDYLSRLHAQFGDWHMALAAYNWGEGNLSRAIQRNQRLGLPTDYQSLQMPDETRRYVPKLQAVKNLIAQPERFGLALPHLANHPYFLSVPIERDIDVDLAARLSDLSRDDFLKLNPQFNQPVILAAGTPHLLLPYDNAQVFVQKLAAHIGPMATWTAWVAPRTLKPAEAAKLVGMSESALLELNRIPQRMLVKAGSTLLVPRSRHQHEDVAEHIAENGSIALAPDRPPLRRVVLKASAHGDSVADVARRHQLSALKVAHPRPKASAPQRKRVGDR